MKIALSLIFLPNFKLVKTTYPTIW